jgi:hypothetical protein
MIPIHKRGEGYSISRASDGLQITLRGQALREFADYHRKAVNTKEPHKWPAWVKDLDELVELSECLETR